MKKILVLTSLLALTACFGGGSGGGGGEAPLPVRSAIADPDVISSNGNVTKMASEILVPTSGGNPEVTLDRRARVNKDGAAYTSYRLDDVNFHVATGANSAYMRFNMDEVGKIDSLIMDVGGVTGTQHMDRNGDTNRFRGIVYEYVVTNAATNATADEIAMAGDGETLARLVLSPSNDITDYSVLASAAGNKCPSGKVCRWDRIDQAFQVSAQGSDFKYSDFGKLQTTNFGKYKGVTASNLAESKEHTRTRNGDELKLGTYDNWDTLSSSFSDTDYDVFAGGYDVRAVQTRPTETTTFTGKAIGSVYATNSDTHPDAGVPLQDDNARLTFAVNTDTGAVTETLNMAFDNWYDVTVTKDASGNNIKFTDWDGSDNSDAIGTAFRDAGSLDKDNFTTAVDTTNLQTSGLLDMGYYGVGETEEATGVVRYKETTVVGGIEYEREFRAGYGMTPDHP